MFPEIQTETLSCGAVLSGGNFHGAPLAYAFDYAAIVLTDLASITERCIDRLFNVDINEGLPACLSPDPGLSSGFMIAQIVAATLINECQVLAHPASTGNIPTDGGCLNGDDRSAQAALDRPQRRAGRGHRADVLSASVGPLKASREVERAHAAVRAIVPRLEQDRSLSPEIEALAEAIWAGVFNEWCTS